MLLFGGVVCIRPFRGFLAVQPGLVEHPAFSFPFCRGVAVVADVVGLDWLLHSGYFLSFVGLFPRTP
jgi:hypothetical protein